MLISMLKAISNMLKTPIVEAKVECAKEVLDELIQHLEKDELTAEEKRHVQTYHDPELDDEAEKARLELLGDNT